MAIAFNLPTDDDTDAMYETLNRLLVELCELLRTMMVARTATDGAPSTRARPLSDSSMPRMPDLLLHGGNHLPRRRICSMQTPPASPSCSFQHLSRTFSEAFEIDSNDPTMAYFGDDEVFSRDTAAHPVGSRSTLPPRQRRRRKRSSSLRDSKKINWNVDNFYSEREKLDIKNIKTDEASIRPIVLEKEKEAEQSEGSLISTLLSTKLGGSLWTAVVLVVGWKLLGTKR